MYVLASHIVSTYSGKSFREFVQERIFDPLNMTSTTYSPVKAQASGNFSQIWSTASAGRRIPYWIQNEVMEEFIAGAGGIISSTVDVVSPDVASEISGLLTCVPDQMGGDAPEPRGGSGHQSECGSELRVHRDDDRTQHDVWVT